MRTTPYTPATSYIITASGNLFYPLAPTVEQVRIFDIASHLSKMGRWTGATKGDEIYTVAQHSVTVSYMCDQSNPLIALDGLHHDSSEALLVDVARPLKYTPGFMEIYMKFEKALTNVIYEAFGIPLYKDTPVSESTHHPSVKTADNRMLATEARDIMPEPVDGYEVYEFPMSDAYENFHVDIIWSPREARERFITRHRELIALANISIATGVSISVAVN